ncbi:MAG: hypothetical protein KDD35_02785 [Bdellovibrionales bacterium]|nr:hypothetical protein [Bdellovibrionales bacterium]
MKQVVSRLKTGDQVIGQVTEIHEDQSMIIGFQGDLVRVHNHTRRKFLPGDNLVLVVTGVRPFAFRLAENDSHHLDISV